ncbi:sensor histidine kinase [Texcoconibacillus texcoconensis]|uniref:Signal transduction histidine-protein kinase/phosphatase DegS n=1 Tax=Texcoconibacillus texcoconensis TaxID=1095777 RepID=A0A840QR18_9BACI|nr:sensor histidine kinase [Texcoconibacillus texcoconensis]MBB5173771.1 two-component system sensor histidine kinase DegS [Texcoconibacillus texcoconensis]
MSKPNLDEILDKMLETVGDSKEQVYDIHEETEREYKQLQQELKQVQAQVVEVIDDAEKMEVHSRFARNRLAEVSKQFSNYSDEDVKDAYEQANDYQVRLAVLRQKEQQLRERRDYIERRLKKLKETVERAEALMSQMTIVMNYLTGDLQNIQEMVEDAKEMQGFGLKIIEAQEEERKRLSRDIHDGPAQMMANVMLRSELVERIFEEKSPEEAMNEVRELREMVKNSLTEVRRIIYDLRPMALDDLGLVPTLAKYLKNIEERGDVTVSFQHVGRDRRLPTKMEVALFRFVQEAVTNALKHGEPKKVIVKIELKATKVIVAIKDDGNGFDPEDKKEGSFGLVGMKERVNMLDGEFSIDSKLNKGTLIVVQLPIKND